MTDYNLNDFSYLALRPTLDPEDAAAPGFVDNYREVQIQAGKLNQSTLVYALHDTVQDALDRIFELKAKYPHLRLWYGGDEVQAQFTDIVSFAAIFIECDDTWKMIEGIANGTADPACDEYLDAIEVNPLMGALAEKVMIEIAAQF